ncbi:MAG: hypothetical protein COA79_22980 [Planctomycetota bacterium]|nr:MAG: hypothetical protein COA79_22980 [Planctomycetota bacterium]
MDNQLKILISNCIFILVLFSVNAEEKVTKFDKGGFIDFNLYPKIKYESDSVFTVNIFSKLPFRFSYFSLSNFGNQTLKTELSETNQYYTEQNIRWQIHSEIPIDITAQWNLRSGDVNDRIRFGFRWSLHKTKYLDKFFKTIALSYSINYHALQFDRESGYNSQLEHVYKFNLFKNLTYNRLYLAGFMDHSFGGLKDPKIVTEHQLGLRIIDQFYIIFEFRYNGYRNDEEESYGAGVEYIIKW